MFWILRSNPIFYSTNKTSIYDWLQTLLLLIFIIQLDTVINEDKTKFLYTLHIPITLMKYRLVARESYRYALRRSKVTLLFLCSVSPFFDIFGKNPAQLCGKSFSLDYLENSKFNFGWIFEVLKLKNSRGSRNCMYKNVQESSSKAYALSNHDVTFF